MIHFVPEIQADGTRELYIEDTDIFVGEIRRGRDMTNLSGNWTEWQFFASPSADPTQALTPIEHATNRGIGEAYAAARTFAAATHPAHA